MGSKYDILIMTIGAMTGYGYRCKLCTTAEIAPGHEDAYFFAAKHIRTSHKGK